MTATKPRPIRSPLKEKPLPQAGQSVDKMMENISDDFMAKVAAAIGLSFVTGWEWWHYLSHWPLQPGLMTVLAVVIWGWVISDLIKCRATLKRLRQGRDGERVAGEALEKLRVHGYEVFHDIVAGDFNIDHVVVGPGGVFAIETKTLSKRGGAEEKAVTDGETISIRGWPLPENPVPQAKGNARWVAQYLRETTGRGFEVTPVVLMPGWFVEMRTDKRDLLLLNDHENSLRGWIGEQKPVLPREDQALIASRLRLFLRSK